MRGVQCGTDSLLGDVMSNEPVYVALSILAEPPTLFARRLGGHYLDWRQRRRSAGRDNSGDSAAERLL